MLIRQATIADLPQMESLGQHFYAKSAFLDCFEIEKFCAFWSGLMENGLGTIFALFEDNSIRGVIGGMAYPEPYSGIMVATEMFWYVDEGFRGQGLRLYRRLEDWARERGCKHIRMVHLQDSMPEKLTHVYKRLGFVPMETHYTKRLAA